MKWMLPLLLVMALASSAGLALPDYLAQSSNTIVGVTVSPDPGPQPLGTTYYTINISDGAMWYSGSSWYDVTAVCGLAVYPNAGAEWPGEVTFVGQYDDWRLHPADGIGTLGVNGFGWDSPDDPIPTPASGSTGPISIGYATYTNSAPPDVQYLLHVYVSGFNSPTVWGAPGNEPPPTPEPASAALLAMGMAGFLAVRKRKKA